MFTWFKDLTSRIKPNKKYVYPTWSDIPRPEQEDKSNVSEDMNKVMEDMDKVLPFPEPKQTPAMPKYILIMSDMQFDQCARHDDSAMQMIERKYTEAGYTVPNIVFWNLNAKAGQSPVKFDKKGTALVSGFSPAILQSILAAEDLDPTSVMMQTLNSDRYAVIA